MIYTDNEGDSHVYPLIAALVESNLLRYLFRVPLYQKGIAIGSNAINIYYTDMIEAALVTISKITRK